MELSELQSYVENNFSKKFVQYRAFQEKDDYRDYWNLCLNSLDDKVFFDGIIFCNDILKIPPLKVFLLYNKENLIYISKDPSAKISLFLARSLGSFWAFIFKNVLHYSMQERAYLNTNLYFNIKTASYYIK